ncbi:hypothetical protein [Micromonospora echinofusca]|uniref:hypothetical protein n=1 Tax=Micromonospora echinofusca TaxID=47858 RepID=UPI0033FDC8BA
MFKKLEGLSERVLNRFVPSTVASASCPCGSYPYTGPCYYYLPCGMTGTKKCLCKDSASYIQCYACVEQ